MRIHQLKEILQLNKLKIPSQQQLKKGQIIQGQVIKIYPENKVQIQLGGLRLIAQLQASLTTGKDYYFQVMQADELLKLKVLGNGALNANQLLQQLSLKMATNQAELVQQLTKEQISFHREQLQQAFEYMSQYKDKQVQVFMPIMKELIANEWPITEQTTKALHMQKKYPFATQLQKLLHMLPKDSNFSMLRGHLSDLLQPTAENIANSQEQMSKILSFRNKQVFSLIQSLLDGQDIYSSNTINNLKHYIANNQWFMQHADQILKKWESKLLLTAANQYMFSDAEVSQLKQDVTKVFPTLFAKNVGNGGDFGGLLVQLRALQKSHTYEQLEQIITFSQKYLLAEPKEQFLQLTKRFLQLSGISHENLLVKGESPPTTIKSQLISMLQQTKGGLGEQLQQVLHHLHAVQLSSVQDFDNGFLQAYLQIPALKLGLTNDMEIKFEGKKTETNKLDPNHCRIVFYLELTNIKETVVDMHVQNRNISIHVFNDHIQSRTLPMQFQPLLKKGLKEMNYHLSSISFFALHQGKKAKTAVFNAQSYQGVDYRI
ncbi:MULTISPECIES: hypothetical protein [Virgibacillus]|uniref:Flagellar hook-length control protein FliK n=1 Tax=Virgibacillus dokdonensis TaxID=302167 RepID=A0A2K9J423_9BACI|nr:MULTISPECIES: hypothetical protein [Virgibacillus]AUJ26698.1 hypothetical protein A21D_03664 [Virgibacillus dokdonensis]NWO12954.1 hypothetical protein [Virgibacillus sp.]